MGAQEVLILESERKEDMDHKVWGWEAIHSLTSRSQVSISPPLPYRGHVGGRANAALKELTCWAVGSPPQLLHAALEENTASITPQAMMEWAPQAHHPHCCTPAG